MGLIIAGKSDVECLTKMAKDFANSSVYAPLTDENKMETFIMDFIVGDKAEKIIFNHSNVGMLAAMVIPFLFGNVKFAAEIAWWVDPVHRRSNIGRELIDAFEFWAKRLGCHACVLATLTDHDVGKFYEKLGYINHERSYYKEIR